MKKTIIALGVISSSLCISAQADTLLGLYAGAQAWNMATTGGFSDDGINTQFTFDDESKGSFYVALEHPVPLIPNIKVQKTNLDTKGNIVLNTNFTFGGELFTSNTDVLSDIELQSTDFILYYELFDNDLISFDVGINAKYIDGILVVLAKDDPSFNGREEFSGIVPMLYSRIGVGIPATGFGAYIEGSLLSMDDQTLSDYQAALTYSLMDNLAIDMTLQVGYRTMNLELDDLDGIYSDFEFSGAFVGLEVHF
ncbi:MAG: outer membrane protein [Paraglaciecola sp.]|jgi:outer membrane protein